MTSTLGHAILGLLARREQTGYALARRMSRPIGYFWAAGHSQIYPELARLSAAGLVRHRVVKGRGPRPTKQYAITAAGRRALAGWVRSEPEVTVERDAMLLRLYSSWTVNADDREWLVRGARDRAAERLAAYEFEETRFEADKIADRTSAEFAAYATLQRGIHGARAELSWCHWLLAELAAVSPARS